MHGGTAAFRRYFPASAGPLAWIQNAHVIYSRDRGPNTGGVAIYAPLPPSEPGAPGAFRVAIVTNIGIAATDDEVAFALNVARSDFAHAIRRSGTAHLQFSDLASAQGYVHPGHFMSMPRPDGQDVFLVLDIDPSRMTEAEFARFLTGLVLGPRLSVH